MLSLSQSSIKLTSYLRLLLSICREGGGYREGYRGGPEGGGGGFGRGGGGGGDKVGCCPPSLFPHKP